MSKLDDIIARNKHEDDSYEHREARRAMDDRDHLLGLVKDLTEALQTLLTASAGYDSCSVGQQDEYDEAANYAQITLDKVKA